MNPFSQTIEQKNAESVSRDIQNLIQQINARAIDLRLAVNSGELSLLRERLRDLLRATPGAE